MLTEIESRFAQLLDKAPRHLVRVSPRQVFRGEGAGHSEAIIVRAGIVSKFVVDLQGRRQIVGLRYPGEVIFRGVGSATPGLQTIPPTELIVMGASDFEAVVLENRDLQQFLWNLNQRNERICERWLSSIGGGDATARVAHLICETAVRMKTGTERMEIPFTQQVIADITGQTSVNVNRVLSDLEQKGLIGRTGRHIQFSDWPELCRVASFNSSYLDA